MKFQHEQRINATVHDVYSELLNMEKWPETIPHVSRIETVNYSEEIQHVFMSVTSKNRSERMETIRHFKKDEWIDFHQITMSNPLSKHDGIWKIVPDGNGVIVQSIHEIETSYPGIIGKIASAIAWRFFIKENSEMTLRAIKLKLEYKENDNKRIVNKSCFIKHSIDIALPINKAYEVIGNPKLWPQLYPTAIKAEIIKENQEMCEFKLVEYVGKKKFYSHSFLHRDIEKRKLYYQHYPPSFPLKYMVIRWVFDKLDDTHTRFTILREYDLNIPFVGKIIAKTIGKKVIDSHVNDYYRDLRAYEKKYIEEQEEFSC